MGSIVQVTTRQVGSTLPSAVTARGRGDLCPRDRVTLTAGAREGSGSSLPVPRSDVLWYRPRGVAAARYREVLAGRTRTDLIDGAGPRRHAGVARYLRAMQLAS